MTDANGQITDTYTYDTYGEQLEHIGDSQQPFQYNGRDGVQTDPNGLYQMRARYYNPEIKRFVNRDVVTGSIGNGLTMNRYAYVNGNPVSYIDPFGLSADGAEWLKQGGSFVADAIPFVGTAKGIQEVFTGVDLITGQQLSVTDRVAAGGGTLLSWLPGGKVAGKWAVKGTVEGGTWLFKKVVRSSADEVAPTVGRKMAGDNMGVMLRGNRNQPLALPIGNAPSGSSLVIEHSSNLKVSFSESELRVANYMYEQGNQVILRHPVGTRLDGGTSDLLVNGKRYDVYTPETKDASRIIGGIAKKNSQAEGVILDLSKTPVTSEQLGNVIGRVHGIINKGGKTPNINDIIILP
ncbi:RHS repeat-associated core domain-containing protein [Paenibacillus hunanensis]|uniref:RHS repeat-associated core domain-containing protein n=1 Tax=Paenibacillus hunanensis TaxID=539262 RepID=UPI002A69B276|nr:RHS repeat-associated core domain-containing protein [Paenibacillus hunanensis]WPP42132.1 RHS repeat-associated core domain-containing protein [Paenibacillus hunanensis]